MADEIVENEEDKEDVSNVPIKEIILKWMDQQNLAEIYHRDTVITNITVNIFNDNVIAHFRKILEHQQKQQTLDKFLLKGRTTQTKFHLSQRDRE